MSLVGPPPGSWAVDADSAGARQVVPGLWRLRLPLPWQYIEHVNAWVVERDDGVMLVDCGSAGDESMLDAFANALRAAGHEVEDVRALVATHTHSDHVGIAPWVLERSGAELWMHPATGHFYDALRDPAGIEAARGRRARAEGVPGPLLPDYRDVREETQGMIGAVDPDRELGDGVRLPSSLGDWEVIETPGHSPSHVCLVQRERGIAILGDLVSPVFAPYFDYGYTPDPVAEYLASLERVEALGVRLGLPGHGRPLEDVAGAIALHRHGVGDRLAAVELALGAGGITAYDLTRRVFGEPASSELGVWQLG
ncbi:MAG: fold metallo-hydrolase, partial [Solirubrobacterales bacterium]|nr:fold metallo-hydrolase [Solirubrobacterales bacterium]